jgi:hypothetical protein
MARYEQPAPLLVRYFSRYSPRSDQFDRHEGSIATEPGVRQWWYRWRDGWSLADRSEFFPDRNVTPGGGQDRRRTVCPPNASRWRSGRGHRGTCSEWTTLCEETVTRVRLDVSLGTCRLARTIFVLRCVPRRAGGCGNEPQD